MAALKSEKLFDLMKTHLASNGEEVVKKINAVFHFEVSKAKGEAAETWTVDLKNGKGNSMGKKKRRKLLYSKRK